MPKADFAEATERIFENLYDKLKIENARLREAGAKVCEGFDQGVFIRSTKGDDDSAWAIRLMPYLRALAALAATERDDAG